MMRISTEIDSAARRLPGGEERAVELVAEAGFDAYDFSLFEMARIDWATGRMTPSDHPLQGADYLRFVRRVSRAADDCGLKCNQTHAPFPVYCDEIRGYLARAIECTAEAGGSICVIHPDNFKSAEENAEMYLELLPFAKSCGVKIATENMWDWDKQANQARPNACATPADFKAHLEAVNDPYLVACLDIGHAEMRGIGTSAAELVYALGDRLQALHIHDNDRWHDSHQLPFTMAVDFAPIVRALREIDYKGEFTLECGSYLKDFTQGAETEENVLKALQNMAATARRLADMFDKA